MTIFPAQNENANPSILVKRFYKGEVPRELIELRRKVYCEETNFLAEKDLVSENDKNGAHICIYDSANSNLIAAAHVVEAELSDFSVHSGVSKSEIMTSVYGSRHLVAKEYRGQGLFSLLLYMTMREGRLRRRTSLLAYQNEGDIAVNRIISMKPIPGIPPRIVEGNNGHQYSVLPCGQDISYGMHLAWKNMPENVKSYATENLLADEVERTVGSRLETFYDNKWFIGVANGTLTKNQYVEMLGDWHNFVRWTTRLLAKVVGITDDKDLRSSFISHMNGEIDHEVLIEGDLAALGADVDYAKNHMAPGGPIQLFMGLQESLAAFRQDPVLFLAVPYSIEGISANITAQTVKDLSACIASWGYERPRKCCTFLSSHIHTDGGDDGHWQHSLKMIKQFLKTETELQKFLVVSHLVFDTIGASFENAVSKLDFQTLRPEGNRPNIMNSHQRSNVSSRESQLSV